MRRDDFLERLGISLPIIQAPMAGVSTVEMAAAVSNAGGLGSIAVGAADADDARRRIQTFREKSTGPLNVNLFCHRPAPRDPEIERAWLEHLRPMFSEFGVEPPTRLNEIYRSFVEDEAMLQTIVELLPEVVSFHFGLPPQPWIDCLRNRGVVLLATATNLKEARVSRAAGVDAVVAQGWEAGGHRGAFDPDAPDDAIGTLALTRLIAQDFGLPTIAAGGIMDGSGVRAALSLGAAAAQLGTAFIACDESSADPGYREALASEAAHHTLMTRVISGRRARSLPNRFISLVQDTGLVPSYPRAYDAGKQLNAAALAKGVTGFGAYWAGQGAPLASAMPAAHLVERLAAEL